MEYVARPPYELELQKREEKINADAASKTDIGWGHQIRSYVLQPYQMVKDLRTGHVSGTPAEVLDGDLDPFMESFPGSASVGTNRGGRGRRIDSCGDRRTARLTSSLRAKKSK